MADATTPESPGSPTAYFRRVVRAAWNDLLSIYYANTYIWRVLKTGGLIALGLFMWSGANLLLSYRADWGFLYYVMAYGFVLLIWGPLTHLAIVPAVIRFRKSGRGGVRRWLSRHGSKLNFTTFLVIVIILGTAPLGVMTFEFQVPSGGDGGGSVNPDLQCTRSGDVIHCHISDARGIDHVEITSGGEQVKTIEEPPFDFDLNVNELETVDGDRQFTVDLRDENDDTIRRYIRRADLIPG